MKCVIFRCSKKDEMYLYVPYKDDEQVLLSNLPEGLQKVTGRLDKVMELELSAELTLARARVTDVMEALIEKGFYLQMPPNDLLRKDDSMLVKPEDSF